MLRARPAWTRSRWLLAALVLAAVELVLIAGSSGVSQQPDRHPLDVAGEALVALTGVTVVTARRWPVPSFGVALGLILAYAGLGYATDGPIFLVILVTLYFTIRAGEVWRAVAFGTLATVGLWLIYGVLSPNAFGVAQLLFAPLIAGGVVSVAYLANYHVQQVELLRQAEALRLVTDERLRIARELHDVVSHSISVINVQAGVAAHVMDQQPEETRKALLTIKQTSKEALRDLRGMLGVLRGLDENEPRSPAPGLSRLDGLLEATTRAGLPTTLSIQGQPQPLPSSVDLTAYRIVQESLTNALRYAGPAAAKVQIAYHDHMLTVEVTDNGRAEYSPSFGSGLGIGGMRERALAVGGELEAGPLPGGGFRVCARLPIAGGA